MVSVDLSGRDLVTLRDYSAEGLQTIFKTAINLKLKLVRGEPHELLRGKTLAMVFTRPSTRTRVSFETAMNQLGGHAMYLSSSELQAVRGETWKDTARVISQYADGIMTRLLHDETLEFVTYATVPVINGSDLFSHPTQVLADFLTILEKKKRFEGVKYVVSWGYGGSFIEKYLPGRPLGPTLVYDTMFAAPRMGMDLVIACPEGYDPYAREIMDAARQEAEMNSTLLEISHNLEEAVDGADAIMVKPWSPWGYEGKKLPLHDPEELRKWCIDSRIVDRAKNDVIVMQPGPMVGFDHMTEEVKEGPHSVYFDEAGNRLHVEKAALALLMR